MHGIMLMLVSMTLTLIQGHSGSAEESNVYAMAFKLRMAVYMTHMLMFVLTTLTLSVTSKTFVLLVLLVSSSIRGGHSVINQRLSQPSPQTLASRVIL